ncbi:hypothetical protein QBC46DRAFT_391194 [Diplogelasinospora grovesii]|uniref:Zn(2)-C6 fungal-type domain-containing protein n=1 Tax=Diplogelasinospora grovesii TaxID=303347 RepID=A0AAN6N2L8_9PEZI|nr:hypothetical protein QBC46DRAFT_391194 [Diplogelasinospora grovesii]
MFGIFKYNSTTGDSECISLADRPSSALSDRAYYQRSACDLCRAKKLKCNGDEEICDRCGASSSPCTYTLSSGTGAGKKRLRKTFTTAHPGFKAMEKRGPQVKRQTPAASPAQHSEANDQEGAAFSDLHGSDPGFSLDLGIDSLWSLPPDAEFLTGNNFTFTLDAIPSGSQLASSPLGTVLPPPSATPTQEQPTLDKSIAESRSTSGWADVPATPTQGKASPQTTYSTGVQKCGCLCSILKLFEDTGVRIAAGQATSSDTLFLCLQHGIQKCRAMLSCQDCRTCNDNPILLATVGSQLVVVAGEIVNRFIQCQSRNTVPTVFQFRRYSVECPAMRTRLLRNMIAMHVEDIQDLLGHLQSKVEDKPGPTAMLEEERRKCDRMAWLTSQTVDSPDANYN